MAKATKAAKTAKAAAQPASKSTRASLSDFSQIHGAAATPSTNKYMTGYDHDKPDDYLAYLNRLENADLYDHAIAQGEVPVEPKERLVDRLYVRFLHAQAATIPRSNIPIQIDPKREEAFRKIMSGAR